MDYNIQDVEKTVSELQRQVDELNRVLQGMETSEFRYIPAEARYEQRMTKMNVKGGASHTAWDKVPITAETGDVLPDGSADNRYLVWDTVAGAWAANVLAYPAGTVDNRFLTWDTVNNKWIPSQLIHPAGTADNRYLVWDTATSKWVPGELAYPAGSTTNRFLTWDATNSKWIPTKLIHPAGSIDNVHLRWDTATSEWVPYPGSIEVEPSTVDGHVLETWDNAGTKEIRWGFTRMKDI